VSAPTATVRAQMLDRDDRRCAACALTVDLEAQHRQATGMGGRRERPALVELLTLCTVCNQRCEADAAFQRRALLFGWKVRRWIADPGMVPVRYSLEGWFRLTTDGRRLPVTRAQAEQMMREAYGPAYAEGGVL